MLSKVFFIGFFNPPDDLGKYGSAAGTKVQLEIIRCLEEVHGSVKCIVMREVSTWPRNKVFYKSIKMEHVYFPFFINIKFFKILYFSMQTLIKIFKSSPQVVYQYNSYLSVNLVSFLFKICGVKTVLILQDINCTPSFIQSINPLKFRLGEYLGLILARYAYSVIVPISDAIITDFKFNPNKCIVWRGGIIGDAYICKTITHKCENKFAVVAGTLNAYNGIFKLVEEWVSQEIPYDLHIFGDGEESAEIKRIATYSNHIKYHGRVTPNIVSDYLNKSSVNFCLRYSIVIDERYFFPSKFFDIFLYPGSVVVNSFYGLPDEAKDTIFIVSDDLSNLRAVINFAVEDNFCNNYTRRKKIAKSFFLWNKIILSVRDFIEKKSK